MALTATAVERELEQAVKSPLVSVTLVTYNSEKYILPCLEGIESQSYRRRELIIVDNASTDATRICLKSSASRFLLLANESNLGFAAAQNQAIRRARGELILTLNPDVSLEPTFLERLVASANEIPWVGMFTGKLLRADAQLNPVHPAVIDSTGIYFTPELRHLDRGSGESDRGHYEQREYVFGATAAAALYRRELIEDVSIEGELFDEDFFAYREDADLAWRAQLFGWQCLYVPEALAYHVRRVLPERRGEIPAELNMHSVKNRFLMRIKNMTPMLYTRVFLPATWRDLQVAAYVLLREHGSLAAFTYIARNLRQLLVKRRIIQSRRRVNEDYLMKWFSHRPAAFPFES